MAKVPPRLQIEVLGPAPIVRPLPGAGCDYQLCGSIAQLREYLRPALQDREAFGADWESTSLNTHIARPVGLAVSIGARSGLYVPVAHQIEPEANLPMGETLQALKDADAAGAVSLWFNVLYDHELSFRALQWVPVHWHDAYHGVFLVDSNVNELGLKASSSRFLGLKMQELAELDTEWIRLSKAQRKLVPMKLPHDYAPHVVMPYGCADADHTRQLWFHPDVQRACREQGQILAMEEALSPIMRAGNRFGAYLHPERLQQLREEVRQKLDRLTPQIHQHFGEEFALSRKTYLAQKLVALVPAIAERTAGGDPTVSVKVLDKYRAHHPVIPLLILHAQLTAQDQNYLAKLLLAHDYFTQKPWAHGRVRFAFNHIGVPTGRMKCGGGGKGLAAYEKGVADVNAQSFPDADKGAELPNVRSGFVAPSDFVVVAIDYSQIEVRIPTNLSKEPKWVATYKDPDGDIHLTNAQIIAAIREPGVVVTKHDKKRRGAAKAPLFAFIYQGDEHTVARNAGIPLKEAKEMFDAFVNGLPVLMRWIEGIKAFCVSHKKAVTFMGRVRHLGQYFLKEPPKPPYSQRYDANDIDPETGLPRPTPAWRRWKAWARLRAQGLREGVNHPVQGGAADIFKMACVRIAQTVALFVEKGVWPASSDPLWCAGNPAYMEGEALWGPCAVVSPQVLWEHDEIVFYCHKDWVARVVPVITKAMEFPISGWVIPLKAEPEIGSRRLYLKHQIELAQKDERWVDVSRLITELEQVTGPDDGVNSSWGELVSLEMWLAAQQADPAHAVTAMA